MKIKTLRNLVGGASVMISISSIGSASLYTLSKALDLYQSQHVPSGLISNIYNPIMNEINSDLTIKEIPELIEGSEASRYYPMGLEFLLCSAIFGAANREENKYRSKITEKIKILQEFNNFHRLPEKQREEKREELSRYSKKELETEVSRLESYRVSIAQEIIIGGLLVSFPIIYSTFEGYGLDQTLDSIKEKQTVEVEMYEGMKIEK